MVMLHGCEMMQLDVGCRMQSKWGMNRSTKSALHVQRVQEDDELSDRRQLLQLVQADTFVRAPCCKS